MLKFPFRRASLIVLAATSLGASPLTAAPVFPIIKGYGGMQPIVGTAERPDKALRYRVVFNITKPPPAPGKVNPTLDRMARFINLLGADGVRASRGDLVAIVHGGATPLIMTDKAHRAKFGVANPNLELIARLRATGAEVHVCSQALAGNKIAKDAVNSAVQIDAAALTTLANLQLRGYAMIPD